MFGNVLCDLWCSIQVFNNLNCVTCPKEYNGNIQQGKICDIWLQLSNLQLSNSTALAPSKPNVVECPYQEDSSSNILCSLWCQIQSIEGSKCVICPEELQADPAHTALCDLYFQLQVLEEEIPIPQVEDEVSCVYKNHTTSSTQLCNLWCKIQEFSGKNQGLLMKKLLWWRVELILH